MFFTKQLSGRRFVDALKLSFLFCVTSVLLRVVVMEPLLSAPLLAIYRAIETVVGVMFYARLCAFAENCGSTFSSIVGGLLGILLTLPVYVLVVVFLAQTRQLLVLD